MSNTRIFAMLAPAGSIRIRLLLRMPVLPASIRLHVSMREMVVLKAPSPVHLTALANPVPACFIADHACHGLPSGVHRVVLELDGVQAATLDVQVSGLDTAMSLRLLMGSCYWFERSAGSTLAAMIDFVRRSDIGGDAPRPLSFSVLMGDQVYLDLPLVVQRSDRELAAACYSRYLHQWFDDADFAALLQSAPVVMIADDHELWNNAPRAAPHIPDTWTDRQKEVWLKLGRELFDQFQLIPELADEGARTRRWSQGPLHAVFVDARLSRNKDSERLFGNADENVVRAWAEKLRAAPTGSVGLLAIGQPLLDPDVGWFKERLMDAGLADYERDYQFLLQACAGIAHPIIVLTGDVHFGRALKMQAMPGRGHGPLIEVVCSALSLIPPGSASEPEFDINAGAFKRHGYQRVEAKAGVRSSSMVGALSIDFSGKVTATMTWLHMPEYSRLPQTTRCNLLPEFIPIPSR